MKIVFVHRKKFHQRPPVISVVKYLSELGYKPHVITAGIDDNYRKVFAENSISLTVIPFDITNHFVLNAINGYQWGIKARREIKRISEDQDIVLWVEGNYTYDSLGAKFINKYPHVLQHQEFPDIHLRKGRYTMGNIKKIAPKAIANLAPEYNRSWMYAALCNLPEAPLLLPNKPAFLPTKEGLVILEKKYKYIKDVIGKRKVILYQGNISKERNLVNFVKAIQRLDNNEYALVFLGRKTKYLEEYKRLNPNLIHVDYIPAPDYLYITSIAYVGIVTYASNTLNTVYCAPNKIYEYGAFGVPMIGNDIPGLRYTVGMNRCGILCDDKSVDSIYDGLVRIFSNYEEYSKNARIFYDSTDNKATINRVITLINTFLSNES